MLDDKLPKTLQDYLQEPDNTDLIHRSLEEVNKYIQSSEHLQRYNDILSRRGNPQKTSFEPPNYPYELHRS